MGNFQSIKIEQYQQGLNTDASATDLPLGTATVAENINPRSFGKLKKSGSYGSFTLNGTALPSIPTPITSGGGGTGLLNFHVFNVTQPSAQDIILIYGKDSSGRARLYLTPHYTNSAFDQTSWRELTEGEAVTVNTATSGTNFTITGASNNTDDYYNGWYVYKNNQPIQFDYVLDYVGSTNTLTTKYGMGGITASDNLILMRFPIFQRSASLQSFYNLDNTPTFQTHGENVYVYGGANTQTTGFDLWVGYLDRQTVNNNGYFQDSDLDYVGFHCEHAQPFQLHPNYNETIGTARFFLNSWYYNNDYTENTITDGSGLPFTANTIEQYLVQLTGLLDGFQESSIFINPAEEILANTDVSKFKGNNLSVTDGNRTVTLHVKTNPMGNYHHFSEYMDNFATGLNFIMSRRLTHFNVYLSQAPPGNLVKPINPFYQVKTISIDHPSFSVQSESTWAASTAYAVGDSVIPTSSNVTGYYYRVTEIAGTGTSGASEPTWPVAIGVTVTDNPGANQVTWVCVSRYPNYELDVDIDGFDWEAAQSLDYATNKGHGNSKTGANAQYAAQATGVNIVGPVYADQQLLDTIIISSKSGAIVGNQQMPAVLPLQLNLQFRNQGLNEIKQLVAYENTLIAFGENTFVQANIDGLNTTVREQFQSKGLVSSNGVQEIDRTLYFCSQDSIYAFSGIGDTRSQVIDIGKPIKEQWQAIPLADRQSAITGIDENLKLFFIRAGTTNYVYDTLEGYWKTYVDNISWTIWNNKFRDRFLGSDGSQILDLTPASTQTSNSSLKWRSSVFDVSKFNVRRLRVVYRSSDSFTVKIYNELSEPSNPDTPIKTMTFNPSTVEHRVSRPLSIRTNRLFIEVETTASTNTDFELDAIELDVKPIQRR